jgi:hypothetical protein
MQQNPDLSAGDRKVRAIVNGAAETCAVCINDINPDKFFDALRDCGHVFCAECHQKYVADASTCAMCRGPYSHGVVRARRSSPGRFHWAVLTRSQARNPGFPGAFFLSVPQGAPVAPLVAPHQTLVEYEPGAKGLLYKIKRKRWAIGNAESDANKAWARVQKTQTEFERALHSVVSTGIQLTATRGLLAVQRKKSVQDRAMNAHFLKRLRIEKMRDDLEKMQEQLEQMQDRYEASLLVPQ